MIKIKLKQLLAQRAYDGERMTLVELAEQTGISRTTLQRIANTPGHSTTTEHIDKLCKALNCNLNDLIEFSQDE
ncbi:helix-turn-helix domain-containing protein [Mariprofundus ferrooxydans]|uniref:HTH cro/C1-type domain-containing protein n=1 Tax=Mariprofundus ferrooxydans PV-1 TaxID=314345 RepID=Q0F1I3_9PROT|nr:helix-turn-helix transcriptional regulator [Mariprofundus ferrooxydans]EAU55208.1 hypothetical protein SPV1_10766 [Mariprofundus ferrooxydans PV-1]